MGTVETAGVEDQIRCNRCDRGSDRREVAEPKELGFLLGVNKDAGACGQGIQKVVGRGEKPNA